MKTVIRNAKIFKKSETLIGDIAFSTDRIEFIGEKYLGSFDHEIDGQGKWVLPGMIDTQVHFRDPGLTHKEDLASGSQAAALGGVTTFLEMPNTKPSTTSVKAIKEKIQLANEKSCTNFGFFIGANGENLSELKEAQNLDGVCGTKIFLGSSTGDLLLYNQEKLLEIFENVKGMIACHSENEQMLNERLGIRDNAKTAHEHPVWRSVETALSSTEMVLSIAKKAKRKIHILHITTQEEIEFLNTQKEHCTVEVTPQHLLLSAPDCYDRLGTYAQMNPPIREKRHADALWKGVLNKTVDVIGSDHAPHTKEEKDKGYPMSPSGMPGVQTIFPLLYNCVAEEKLNMEHLLELLCYAPARLYQLDKMGDIQVGYDSNIILFDPNIDYVIKNEDQASRCGWTPFDGKSVKGRVINTYVNGVCVVENSKLTGQKGGQAIKKKPLS